MLFTASNLASITSPIHNWVLLLLCLHPFILCGVISPLISSSILGTYRPGKFFFQYPTFLPFHTVHGVLKAKILKWFAIPFSSGPHSVRPLHHDLAILGGSYHEILIAKFRLKLKKVGQTTRPFRYDLNQIPYDYTGEVRNRFKGLDLIDRVLDEL